MAVCFVCGVSCLTFLSTFIIHKVYSLYCLVELRDIITPSHLPNTISLSTNKQRKIKITLKENQDPSLGLDEFGDIVIGLNELPIIRGGWYDRYSNYYEDGLSTDQFGSMNIVIKDIIRETQTIKMINKSKKSIK